MPEGAHASGIIAVAMAASANPISADKAVRVLTLFCTALKRAVLYVDAQRTRVRSRLPAPYPFSVVEPGPGLHRDSGWKSGDRPRYLQRAPEARRAIDRRCRACRSIVAHGSARIIRDDLHDAG